MTSLIWCIAIYYVCMVNCFVVSFLCACFTLFRVAKCCRLNLVVVSQTSTPQWTEQKSREMEHYLIKLFNVVLPPVQRRPSFVPFVLFGSNMERKINSRFIFEVACFMNFSFRCWSNHPNAGIIQRTGVALNDRRSAEAIVSRLIVGGQWLLVVCPCLPVVFDAGCRGACLLVIKAP